MNLSELYNKEVDATDRRIEVLRSDVSPSGHFITLKDPLNAEASRLVFMFDQACLSRAEPFETDNKEMLARCVEIENHTEYNLAFEAHCQDLRDAFAVELVEGWDFDNEFTVDALKEAIAGFRSPMLFSLERQIIDGFRAILEEHSKK